MNERIRELYRQAVKESGFDYLPSPTLEKFGELIILECVNMARSFHNNGYDFTGDLELHEFIQEHFGIK